MRFSPMRDHRSYLVDGTATGAQRRRRQPTRPRAEVWPWLVQMGQGRGSLYTYEWIENLLGAKMHNLGRLDPNLQRLQVGDRIRLTPDLYLGRIPGQFYRVTAIRHEDALSCCRNSRPEA